MRVGLSGLVVVGLLAFFAVGLNAVAVVLVVAALVVVLRRRR